MVPISFFRKIFSPESIWTFFLVVLIGIFTYWINSPAETGNSEPLLRAPLSIPPTPQLVHMETTPLSLNGSTEWSTMKILGSFPYPLTGIGVSTSGEIFAAGLSRTQINYCHLGGSNQIILAEDFNPSLDEIAISTNQHLLATGTYEGNVLIWELMEKEGNRRLFTLTKHPGRIQALSFSRNGKTLAVGTAQGTWLWEIGMLAKLTGIFPGQDIREIAFSNNGKWLATLEKKNEIWIRSRDDGRVLQVLNGFQGNSLEFIFSPEDRLVVAISFDENLRFWSSDFALDEGRQSFTFTSLLRLSLQPRAAQVSSLAFSPDGNRIIFGNTQGDIYAIDKEKPQEPASLPFHFFERLPFNQFSDEETNAVNPGCGQVPWHKVLLNRPDSIDMEIAQIQPSLGDKFKLQIENTEHLGRIHYRSNVSSDFYKIHEDNVQKVLLIIHEPDLIGSGVELAIDFLDRKVGAAAHISTIQIDDISLEYLQGGWAFYITDEPVFFAADDQFGDVQWRSEWETESHQQTLRWKHAGRLFEIILLPKQAGIGTEEATILTKGDLLSLAQQIIAFMKTIEMTP